MFVLVGFEAIGFGEAGDDYDRFVGDGDSFAVDEVFVFVGAGQELLLDLVADVALGALGAVQH